MKMTYCEGTFPVITHQGVCVHIGDTLDDSINWVEENWVEGESCQAKIIEGSSRKPIVIFSDDDPPQSAQAGYLASELLKYIVTHFDRED